MIKTSSTGGSVWLINSKWEMCMFLCANQKARKKGRVILNGCYAQLDLRIFGDYLSQNVTVNINNRQNLSSLHSNNIGFKAQFNVFAVHWLQNNNWYPLLPSISNWLVKWISFVSNYFLKHTCGSMSCGIVLQFYDAWKSYIGLPNAQKFANEPYHKMVGMATAVVISPKHENHA